MASSRKFATYGTILFLGLLAPVSAQAALGVDTKIKTSYAIGRDTAEEISRAYRARHANQAKQGDSLEWSWTGSAGAVSGLLDGSADIAFSARELTRGERDLASRLDIEIVEVFVGAEATAVIVHRSNELLSLDFTQLTRITSGASSNWSQLGGAPRRIRAYLPLTRTPRFAQIESALIGMRNRALSDDIAYVRDPAEIVRRVRNGRDGIGFVPSTLVGEGVRVVPLVSPGSEPTVPQVSSIRDRTYPLVHTVLAYYRSPPSSRVRRLLTFLTLQEGGEVLADAGFVRPDDRSFPVRQAQTTTPAATTSESVVTRVGFDFRSARLGARARNQLRSFAQSDSEGLFHVVGHVADNERPELEADELALERAQRVASFLRELVTSERIVDITSVGNAQPSVEPGSAGALRTNRRVDVWRLARE